VSKICCLDFETTSADPNKCSVVEIGAVIFDYIEKKPLTLYSSLILPPPDEEELTEGASKVNGISEKDLAEYGITLEMGFGDLSHFMGGFLPKVDYIVAHNGNEFDRIIFKRLINKYKNKVRVDEEILGIPWIDTMTDIPYPENIKTRTLVHLCYDHGYFIQNAHRALFDALGCAHLISQYDFKVIEKWAKSPTVTVVAAICAPWKDGGKSNEEIKKFRFRYDPGPKEWYKKIKEHEFIDLQKKIPYELHIKVEGEDNKKEIESSQQSFNI